MDNPDNKDNENNEKKQRFSKAWFKSYDIYIYPDGRMSIIDTAKLLNISHKTLYNWIQRSKKGLKINKLNEPLPKPIKIGRNVYFYYDEIEEWIMNSSKKI